jgi:isocitrate/isopropylmalate dehydrogenase
MLRHGLDREDDAVRVEGAVETVLAMGLRTADLATGAEDETEAGTEQMTEAVVNALSASPI